MLLRYFWNSRGDAFEILGLFFPQEENLRRFVWNSWEIKEIFILDGYTHSLASYPVYFSHISWLTVFKFGSILCELLSASLIMYFDVYSLTASKSLHLLFLFFWRWLTFLLILILDLVICLAACLGLAKQSRWLLTTWVQTWHYTGLSWDDEYWN